MHNNYDSSEISEEDYTGPPFRNEGQGRKSLHSSIVVNTSWIFPHRNHSLQKYFTSSPLFPEDSAATPINHVYSQFANLTLFIIFFLLFFKRDLVFIKTLGCVYAGFSFLWAWFWFRSVDLVVWSGVFFALNLLGIVKAVVGWTKGNCGKTCSCCCSDIRNRERKELEDIYNVLFAPVHITRDQFRTILSFRQGIKTFKPGDHYAVEKGTRVEHLGLVLNGLLDVTQNGKFLHKIQTWHFVDSPEYFGVSTDEPYQVTITAKKETRILLWHRDKLRLCLNLHCGKMNHGEFSTAVTGGDSFLRIMFDHVVGRDVVRKLVQVSDNNPPLPKPSQKCEFSQALVEAHNQGRKVPKMWGVEENKPLVMTTVVKDVEYSANGTGDHGSDVISEQDENDYLPGSSDSFVSNFLSFRQRYFDRAKL